MSEMSNPSPELESALLKIKSLENLFAWICLDAVSTPTPSQIKAVQVFYPNENLLTVRRRLTEGNVRIGPLDPEAVNDFAAVALFGINLTWRVRTGAELEGSDPVVGV